MYYPKEKWNFLQKFDSHISESAMLEVDSKYRLDLLKLRRKPPLIYHNFNVSNVFATLNIQIKLMTNDSADEIFDNSKIVLLLRHEKLPTLNNCDLVQTVSTIKQRTNESYADWFIGNEFMTKGKWFLAVASLKKNFENDVIQNMKSCQENDLNLEMLSWEFQIANYTLRSFIGGAYYFDESREEWNGYGINVNIIISY